MSGHVEGLFECFVSLTVGSTKGPLAYQGHTIKVFMDALQRALEDPKFTFTDRIGGKHRVHGATVFHVGPTIGTLQRHFADAASGRIGDVPPERTPRGKRARRSPRRR